MTGTAPATLGLDIGARRVGVAVFRGEELVFYAVKSIRRESETETLKRLEKTLAILIEKYGIEAVALEKIVYPQQQRRSIVKAAYQKAKRLALKNRLRLFEYDPALIRRIICRNEKSTKNRAALLLSEKYAELARCFNAPKNWQRQYYSPLFDAVAAGFVCSFEKDDNRFSGSAAKRVNE